MSHGSRRSTTLPLVYLSVIAMTTSVMATDAFTPVSDEYLLAKGGFPMLLSDSLSPYESGLHEYPPHNSAPRQIAATAANFNRPVTFEDDIYPSSVSDNLGEFIPRFSDPSQQTLNIDPGISTLGSTAAGTPLSGSPRSREEWEWILLPDGLLWHSYLAGPQEPRISALLLADEKGGYFWDATLGGRVGFLRYGTPGAKDPHGWQWDLEGAAITRMDVLEQTDIESVDYRFGTELTWAEGPWAMKAGYFHISSHVGDEYLIRNPTFDRINYVTESLIWGVSYKPVQPVRLYGEVAHALHRAGGARPFQFQTGAEWTPEPKRPNRITPFIATNLGFFESTEFHMQTTIQAGWYFQGPESDRRLRFGLQYGDGPSNQFEFFARSQEYLGWGIWFDF